MNIVNNLAGYIPFVADGMQLKAAQPSKSSELKKMQNQRAALKGIYRAKKEKIEKMSRENPLNPDRLRQLGEESRSLDKLGQRITSLSQQINNKEKLWTGFIGLAANTASYIAPVVSGIVVPPLVVIGARAVADIYNTVIHGPDEGRIKRVAWVALMALSFTALNLAQKTEEYLIHKEALQNYTASWIHS